MLQLIKQELPEGTNAFYVSADLEYLNFTQDIELLCQILMWSKVGFYILVRKLFLYICLVYYTDQSPQIACIAAINAMPAVSVLNILDPKCTG